MGSGGGVEIVGFVAVSVEVDGGGGGEKTLDKVGSTGSGEREDSEAGVEPVVAGLSGGGWTGSGIRVTLKIAIPPILSKTGIPASELYRRLAI